MTPTRRATASGGRTWAGCSRASSRGPTSAASRTWPAIPSCACWRGSGSCRRWLVGRGHLGAGRHLRPGLGRSSSARRCSGTATFTINSLSHVFGTPPLRHQRRLPQQLAAGPHHLRRGLAQQPPPPPGLGPAGHALVGDRRLLLHPAAASPRWAWSGICAPRASHEPTPPRTTGRADPSPRAAWPSLPPAEPRRYTAAGAFSAGHRPAAAGSAGADPGRPGADRADDRGGHRPARRGQLRGGPHRGRASWCITFCTTAITGLHPGLDLRGPGRLAGPRAERLSLQRLARAAHAARPRSACSWSRCATGASAREDQHRVLQLLGTEVARLDTPGGPPDRAVPAGERRPRLRAGPGRGGRPGPGRAGGLRRRHPGAAHPDRGRRSSPGCPWSAIGPPWCGRSPTCWSTPGSTPASRRSSPCRPGAAGAGSRSSVSDNGIGIPRDERRDMFEEFARGKEATRRGTPGVGLGLALVRAVVRAHKGNVEVTSRPGAGSTFRLRLPARPARGHRPGQGGGVTGPPAPRAGHPDRRGRRGHRGRAGPQPQAGRAPDHRRPRRRRGARQRGRRTTSTWSCSTSTCPGATGSRCCRPCAPRTTWSR